MTPRSVPIVTYHSVADPHDHLYAPLSLPLAMFERQLRYLRRHRFEAVTLHQVYDYLHEGAALPNRAVALTFDDGYLDNWVHAFPLLTKYGMKATIFVVVDLVDPRDVRRPTLEDVWAGRLAPTELTWWGHLSWRELETMCASGLIDVQAHTCTHTWHFSGDRVVDFHHPADTYHWLDWNDHPDDKHSWLSRDFRLRVPWGRPVYEHAQTLLKPRYLEDQELSRHLVSHVATNGGRQFFDRSQWRDQLHGQADRYRAAHGWRGRFETDDEYEARVKDEMARSRDVIASRLGRRVDFLCWPCGDYTPRLQQLAIGECGYLATVNVDKVGNRPGDDPTELRRIGFGQDYTGPRRSDLVFMNFVGSLNYHRGVRAAYPVAPIARRLMRVANLVERARQSTAARRHRAPESRPPGATP
jgi:peptidoglycan/xylan/chitin deacetylase (PgdA/CDA1 family)